MKREVKATIYDKKGRVVSVGYNSYIKTHPYQSHLACRCMMPQKVYLHAEIAALVRARHRGYRIVIERYNRHGKPLLSRPCPICQMAIDIAGISVIEYTEPSPSGETFTNIVRRA